MNAIIKAKIMQLITGAMPKSILEAIKQKEHEKYSFSNYKSFSQEGEDLILKNYFQINSTGFYVDVGAHHPKRFSNTYMFYLEGWRGINIDAMPGSMEIFEKLRPRDINIERAVSDKNSMLYYYMFNEPALNTFDPDRAMMIHTDTNKYSRYTIQEKIICETKSLTSILDANMPQKMKIDFLSVDTEGFDLCVIKSLDLEYYRPFLILIEYQKFSDGYKSILSSNIYSYLNKNGYVLMHVTNRTLFFKNAI